MRTQRVGIITCASLLLVNQAIAQTVAQRRVLEKRRDKGDGGSLGLQGCPRATWRIRGRKGDTVGAGQHMSFLLPRGVAWYSNT